MTQARTYSLRPSLPDHRDFQLTVPEGLVLPSKARLLHPPGVRDQGQEGSCTGFSLTTGLACLKPGAYSPAYLYYKERQAEGTARKDAGAQIRDGLRIMQQSGVALESDFPYVVGRFAVPPPSQAVVDARHYKLGSYAAARGLLGVKQSIAMQRAVALGFVVYQSFETTGHDGLVPMVQPGESPLGGHAIAAVGYDDATQRVELQNSWGTGWGASGYCYVPYAYLDNPQIVFEAWSLSL